MSTLTLRLEAYAKDARQVIAGAQALADERENSEVEPLHVLYRLIEREEGPQDAVRRAGVDPTDVLVECESALRKLRRVPDAVAYLSPRLLDLLSRAEGEAARDGGKAVSVGALLLACSQETAGPVKVVLAACGLSAPLLRATIGGADVRKGDQNSSDKRGQRGGSAGDGGDPLEQFGRDLVRMAAAGKFDPTVGRDAELRRILQILARRRENNPLLVGESGIGRGAIVRALAQRLANNDVPKFLEGKRIVALEMSALVAGAKLRGQLEERMRSILDAISDSAGEVILYLPSLAALSGDKASGGAGGMLAAALERGELRVIAKATPDEVRKAFDDGSEIGRRFVGIPIEPPTIDEAIAVLRGVVNNFEIAHGVRISDPALVSAVRFARRYVQGVELPKSAIDLIDEAAAQVRVEIDSVPAELDRMERRLEAIAIQRNSLEDDEDEDSLHTSEVLAKEAADLEPRATAMRTRWEENLIALHDVKHLKEELAAAKREYDGARAGDDHDRAGELRFGTLPLLEKQLAEAEEKLGAGAGNMVRDTVQPEDLADVVATWTGVPVAKMLQEETEKLLAMEERLTDRVIGQDAAVVAVSKAVRRGRVGLRDPKRPIGSFLFLGPTGVGKTELAKALAEFLFDDEASLTRLDMSEFMEKHMVARLLGSPPGYVDSDQGGYLTEAVRRRPYSVVLFDEMEKAHPDVFNILLQVLDDGRLTDSRGRLARFADTVIIMTSNVGGHDILDHTGTAEELEEKVESALHKSFRPEFLNRIDDTVIFNQLSKKDLRGIVEIQLRSLGRLLEHRRVKIEVSDAAKDQLVELGYEPAFGARPLKRVILKHLQDPLAEAMLRGGYGPEDKVVVDFDGSDFTFEKG